MLNKVGSTSMLVCSMLAACSSGDIISFESVGEGEYGASREKSGVAVRGGALHDMTGSVSFTDESFTALTDTSLCVDPGEDFKSRSWQLSVDFDVPSGWSFSPLVVPSGYLDAMNAESRAGLRVQYQFQNASPSRVFELSLKGENSAINNGEGHPLYRDTPLWSPCGQPVRLLVSVEESLTPASGDEPCFSVASFDMSLAKTAVMWRRCDAETASSFLPSKEGESCAGVGMIACEGDLVCQEGACRQCGGPASKSCPDGSVCELLESFNPTSWGACMDGTRPAALGARCGGKSNVLCQDALVCKPEGKLGRCIDPSIPAGLYTSCGGPGAQVRCESGLRCAFDNQPEPDAWGECVPTNVPEGGGCGGPRQIACQEGLVCNLQEPTNEDSYGTCAVENGMAGHHKVCGGLAHVRCPAEDVCVPKFQDLEDSVGVCRTAVVGLNAVCDGPGAIRCFEGLTCIQNEGDNPYGYGRCKAIR